MAHPTVAAAEAPAAALPGPALAGQAAREPAESLGTTIIGFMYRGGMMLCADTRASIYPTVANRVTYKICKLSPSIYTCLSGSVADAQFLVKTVRQHLSDQELQLGQRPSVATAVNLLSEYNYAYRDILLAGFVLGGYDESGPHIYTILPSGSFRESRYALAGSGSGYIMGLMDELYNEDMNAEQALEFGKKLIRAAARRDAASGGIMRWVRVEAGGASEGWTRFD